MIKPFKTPIPPEEIPEGLRLCVKNCKRMWNDAKILYNNESYSSSILLLILAREEFAKSLLLLNHEKDGIDVKTVKRYFGDHLIRLEEFHDFFQKSLGSEMNMKWMSQFDVRNREKHTYVDWTQIGWSYPEYFSPISRGIDNNSFDKSSVESFMVELEQVFWKLEQNENYKKIIEKNFVDRPTGKNLLDIVQKCTSIEKPRLSTEIKMSKIKIELEIHDTSKKDEFETKIKDVITQRFPKYSLNIIIKKWHDSQR